MESRFSEKARQIIRDLGGKNNIDSVVNCATRIRVIVKEADLLATSKQFKKDGVFYVVRSEKLIQLIIGLDVPLIQEEIRSLLGTTIQFENNLDEYGLTVAGEQARILVECVGDVRNINTVTILGRDLVITVLHPDLVDPYSVLLELDIGVQSVKISGHVVRITIDQAAQIAVEINELAHYYKFFN
ncbi:PTS transporter subunit EIIB [Loigolactobacillus coryniformis]|uniref:PTS system, glucose-like IIB component domain protein n=1 Tax=Loigolactobacillus coryniformis subsp. coryniformis CECT 5711 TaxID=1185325 RepID=J3JBX2_9LACO|nr:PTS transporter subunit EIIB [Loigolactobacillus coryniformis]EJN56092.1 PTS system, glucose-like IIB component domain protein [Loigolactobacillus coryniformis subsp. coryniformis CECT 5711]